MTTAYVTHSRYPEHHLPGHPEHAGRIHAVWERLDALGLSSRMRQLDASMADEELILSVHTPDYLKVLRWVDETQQRVYLDPDTYALPTSYTIARLSAGGVITAVDEVLSGRASNGLAAVRPPGHHAMPERAMGFCLLGNIAIAARYAQRQYGLRRVMIVDYDVHHGNGTQAMFYDDASVLFISSHQYPYYPGSGAITETGQGMGTGFTLNMPLAAGHGDASYARLFEQVVWPATRRFEPELILVSAGFDAHWSDPLAGMRLSLSGYAHLSRELIHMAHQFCGGKIVFVLEGGYNLDALGYGMANVAASLLGDDSVSDPLGPPAPLSREADVEPLIAQLRQIHRLE
jgi:acetoin utilization deacetylase AcuC-like enzyme